MRFAPVLKVALVVVVAAAAAAGAYRLLRAPETPPEAPVPLEIGAGFAEPGQVDVGGPFTLVGPDGKTVTDADFRGKYLLVYFGYANCPDVCPTTLTLIARAMDLLGDQAKAVQPLFISVDAKRDTPASVAQFVARFDPRIVGLTGTKEQIDKVATEYGVFYEEDPVKARDGTPATGAAGGDYVVSHSRDVFLMSTQGDYLTRFQHRSKPEAIAATVRKAIATFGPPKDTG